MKLVLTASQTRLAYFLVIALDAISFGLIAPILAPLLSHPEALGSFLASALGPYVLYGLLIALFPFCYMFGAPLLGVASDKWGRKPILLLCLSLALLAFIGYAVAFFYQQLDILIIARICAGLSAGSQGVAQAAVAEAATGKNKAQAISLIAVGMTMGLVIGPLAAGLSQQALLLPFVIVILLTVFNISLLSLAINIPKPVAQNLTVAKRYQFLQTPNVQWLLLIFFLFELGWSMYYQALPIWMSTQWHLQSQAIGFNSAYLGVILVICLILGMRIGLKRASVAQLVRSGFGMGLVGLLLFSLSPQPLGFWFTAWPIALAVALIYSGLISQLSEQVGPEQQGAAMGVSDALLALAFSLTAIIASLLTYVNPLLPFIAATGCWLIAAIICYKVMRWL